MTATYEKLSQADIVALRQERNTRIIGMVVMALLFYVAIPAFVYLVLGHPAYSWAYLLASTLLFAFVGWLVNRNYMICTKDLRAGVKISGTVTIENRHKISLHGNSKCWIRFELDGMRQIYIPSHLYSDFQVGDRIYIEFAEQSRQMLNYHKLEKA